jgi:DNA polymerase-1
MIGYGDTTKMLEPHYLKISDIQRCSGKRVAVDTETTGLNWWECELTDIGLYCPDAGVSGVISTLDDGVAAEAKAEIQRWSSGTTTILHNAKFDYHFLNVNPRDYGWNCIDTTVLIHLLDSRYLKSLVSAEMVFLGESSKRGYVEQAPLKSKIWTWPMDLRAVYCENDAIVTYQLAEELVPQVTDWGLWGLFQKDMQYLSVIYDIETYGIVADQEFMANSKRALDKRLLFLAEQLYEAVGHEFNWRSTKQLSKALYDDLGIPKPKNPFAGADGIDHSRFADAGKYKSTCTSTFLLTEKVHHPCGELVSALRETALMISFLKKWHELVATDGIFHSNFNITGTRTGRLSSSKPNLQNVPSEVRGRFTQSVFTGDTTRTEEYNLRKAFVAREGMIFLSVDYSQMEIRTFAILSKDPNMLKAITSGEDVHLYIALKIWGDCGAEINKIHREWSKTISFGLLYGMTVGSLQYKLNMDRARALDVIAQYKNYFPRIDPWMREIIERCKEFGYVRYWSGRIWREEDPIYFYRGCNALIQGGSADMLSIAAIRVSEWCRKQKNPNDYHIVNLVHDEIITEVPEWDVERCAKEISELMRVEDIFGIPYVTEPKWGPSYGDIVKKGKDASEYEKKKNEFEEQYEDIDEEVEA